MRTVATIALLCSLAVAQEPTPKADPKPEAKTPPMSWTGVLDEKAFAALHELTKDKAPKPEGVMIKIGDQQHYLSLPKTGKAPFPAIVVIHEWYGLNDHIKHWADRLAVDGYAALAVDLYGGKVATSNDEAMAAMKAVDEKTAVATLLEAEKFLRTDPRVAAKKCGSLGWCFGGGYSLQLALASPELDAAVMYYGRTVDEPKKLAALRAPLLGIFGNKDKSLTPEVVDKFEAALKAAKKDARILRYDADHAFANPSGARYDQENAAKAWTEVRQFLAAKLKGQAPDAGKAEAKPKDEAGGKKG